MPCISTVAPWQPYFIGRQQQSRAIRPPGSRSTTPIHFFWGLEDVIAVFTNMWGQLATNKSVGGLFPNDGDGNAWGDKQVGFPPVLDKHGYKLTDPGRYQNLTDNFSAQITAFKSANCEIVTGVVLPPDFTTFWNQALQQGFKPKIASVGKAILFPVAVEALGQERQQPLHRRSGGRRAIRSSRRSPASRRSELADRLRAGDQQAMDAADRLRARALRGRGRRAQALRRHRRCQGDGGGDRRDQPRHGRRARSHGAARSCRPSRRRTSPRRRWSAASGGCATARSTTSSSPTTRPRRTSRSAARWSRSADPTRLRSLGIFSWRLRNAPPKQARQTVA